MQADRDESIWAASCDELAVRFPYYTAKGFHSSPSRFSAPPIASYAVVPPGVTGEGFSSLVFNVSGQFAFVLSSSIERLHWRPKATASSTHYRHSGMAVQCHQCHLTRAEGI